MMGVGLMGLAGRVVLPTWAYPFLAKRRVEVWVRILKPVCMGTSYNAIRGTSQNRLVGGRTAKSFHEELFFTCPLQRNQSLWRPANRICARPAKYAPNLF